MHELAITESIVAAVAERMGDAPIRRLKVEIGRLSGVVPDAVRFCFELAAAGTTLEGAVLEIDEPAGRMRCRSCGLEFDTDDVIALCACGGVGGEAVRGAELRIREVEVA
jgi:hydrogenase nickel incorporation protein HypA/HybF